MYWRHINNIELLRELAQLCGRNVLVLLIDGSLAFGKVGRCDDSTIRILSPLHIFGLHFALFRPAAAAHPPAPDIMAGEIIIGACDIAQVLAGPFTALPFGIHSSITQDTYRVRLKELADLNYCKLAELIDELEEKVEVDIVINTQGGWLTGGRQMKIDDGILKLAVGGVAKPPWVIPRAITLFGDVLSPAGIQLTGSFCEMINLLMLTGCSRT